MLKVTITTAAEFSEAGSKATSNKDRKYETSQDSEYDSRYERCTLCVPWENDCSTSMLCYVMVIFRLWISVVAASSIMSRRWMMYARCRVFGTTLMISTRLSNTVRISN